MNALQQFLESHPRKKMVSIIGLYFTLGGIIAELLPFIFQNIPNENATFLFYLKAILSNVNLAFFTFLWKYVIIFDNGMYINQINFVAYVTGLTGLIFYYFSNERERRLLRFFLSLIVLSSVINLVMQTIVPLFSFQTLPSNFSWLSYIVFKFFDVFIIYLGFWSLKALSADKLDPEKLAAANAEDKMIKRSRGEASSWQRIFNVIFDTYLSILIISPVITYSDVARELENSLGARVSIYILMLGFRLIYYLFFETLFGMTPAKFLSETRVVNQEFQPAENSQIFSRTLVRFVPFEALSFLGENGWHDKWSRTRVMQEQRTGVKGGHYFWVFPVMILLAISFYFGQDAWQKREWHLKAKARHERKMAGFRHRIEHISDKTFLELKATERSGYSDTTYYLKVEEANGDQVYCSVIPYTKSYNTSKLEVEQFYTANQYAFDKVSASRKDIMASAITEYNRFTSRNHYSYPFLSDSLLYQVIDIYEAFGPILTTSGGGSLSTNSFTLNIINEGHPCRITSIRNIEQDIDWITELPIELPHSENGRYPEASLSAENVRKGKPYRFEIEVRDTTANSYRYEVAGKNLNADFIKLDR